ncbi:MAG TPA: peroxiredoxin [Armatimonadota bacterium]
MLETNSAPRPQVGRHAPYFAMDATGGQHVSLDQYRGKWLVLFFYPRDFTFVCPTEIVGFSTRRDEFAVLNAEVLGVSTDSAFVHDAWVRTPVVEGGLGELHYPLGADVTHEVSKAYGVYREEEGLALRGLFIIDPDGVVQYEVVHNLNVGRNIDEVLRVLQGLQTGGLCPLNWKPGEKLLAPA